MLAEHDARNSPVLLPSAYIEPEKPVRLADDGRRHANWHHGCREAVRKNAAALDLVTSLESNAGPATPKAKAS